VLDIELLGVSRAAIIKALEAEGIPGLAAGYQNLHMLPMYQKKMAYGSHGFPWSSDICRREVSYSKGICPIAEALHERSYFAIEMCVHELPDSDVDLMVAAFRKVWAALETLR
jgi:dTDP-4-amino-4,6-dideoxygalactose transaminase